MNFYIDIRTIKGYYQERVSRDREYLTKVSRGKERVVRYSIKCIERATKVLNTVNNAVQRALDSPIIDCGIAITAVASTVLYPPAGGVTVPACTAVLTRRAVARIAPAAGTLIAREIGKRVGKDATQLQREFNILYKSKHGNNGNNNNSTANNNTQGQQPKQRI